MKNTEEQQVTLYLSLEKYPTKPKGSTVGYIQNSILQNKVTLSLKELAEEVAVNSRATKLCELPVNSKNSKRTPIVQQQVLMLDIDNENTEVEYFTLEDALQDDFIKNNATFLYETASSTSEQPKFRVVFVLDNPSRFNSDIEGLYDVLIKKYPQSDSKCRETVRLFFGSTKGYILINWDNRLKMDKKISSPTPTKVERAKDTTNRSKPSNKPSISEFCIFVYNLIETNQLNVAKSQLKAKNLPYFGKEFDSLEDFKQFVLMNEEVSMVDILDLPRSSSFRDIFHDETEPSAGIFRTKNGNVELYKCFSDSQEFTGDIFRVIGRLIGKSTFDSLLLLQELLEIKILNIKNIKQITEVRESIMKFVNYIEDNSLEHKYPFTYKVIHLYDRTIQYILSGFLKSDLFYNHLNGKYEYYNPLSLSSLQKNLYKGDFGYVSSKKQLHRAMTVLTLLGVITKKVDSEIPEYILNRVKKHQEDNNQMYRTEIYTLSNLTYYKLSKMEDISERICEYSVPISSIDYDFLFNTFGKKVADKTFLSNTGPDRRVSEKTQYIENTTVKIILNRLKKYSYIEESYLIRRVQISLRKEDIQLTNTEIKTALNKFSHSMCDNYGLRRLSLTKENKQKLAIKDFPNNKRPNIYILDGE